MKKQKRNKWFLTKKEIKKINEKRLSGKITRKELIYRLIEARLKDWQDSIPEPPKDLFYDEFKRRREEYINSNIRDEYVKIRRNIFAHYGNQIVLQVRYCKNGAYSNYSENTIAKFVDTYGELTGYVAELPDNSVLMKKVKRFINQFDKKDVVAFRLCCINKYSRNKETGKLIFS